MLRAVNLGPHNKVPMADLAELGHALGLGAVRTYIASGNLLFTSPRDENELRCSIERALVERYGQVIGVLVRSSGELAEVVTRCPWPDRPGNRVAVLFTDEAPTLEGVRHQSGEVLVPGKREIFIAYADGIGTSKLVVPVSKIGTARNMNTVRKLAELSAAF